MVQYGVLKWAHDYPNLVDYTDNLRLLERFESNGLLPGTVCRGLHDAYFSFRQEVHRLALLDRPALVEEGRFEREREAVREQWHNLLGGTDGGDTTGALNK
jgi:glutamate-ammonia-ligase adenylyltransferase